MRGPDLHLHSTFSDGLLTPEELVSRAIALGVPAIALTDHDCVDGTARALEAAVGTGLVVVPAVELSAEAGGRALHILGYYVDHTAERLLERLAALRAARVDRARRIVAALAADGYAVALEDVLHVSERAVGRAHIARELVGQGYADDMAQAFQRFLGDDAPYFVPKPATSPDEAIAWIIDAGGVPVLAHPGLNGVDDLIPALVERGLAGIEAFHASHEPATAARYADLARRLGLIVTGGSDFHGAQREGGALGSATAPDDAVDRLLHARPPRDGGR